MKWKTKIKEHVADWTEVFVIFPVKTQDGYTVMLQTVYRRWKIHMSGGKYIYKLTNETD